MVNIYGSCILSHDNVCSYQPLEESSAYILEVVRQGMSVMEEN